MKLVDFLELVNFESLDMISLYVGEYEEAFQFDNKADFFKQMNKSDYASAYEKCEVIGIEPLSAYNLEIDLGCDKHSIEEKNIDVIETEKHDSHMYSFIGETECLDCGLTLQLNGEGTQPSDEETPDWDLDNLFVSK